MTTTANTAPIQIQALVAVTAASAASSEQEDRVEHEHDHGDAALPDGRRDPVDERERGQAKQGAEDLQRAELPQAEHMQNRAGEQVVARQPRVLHAEQRVVQLSSGNKVRRDEPVAVAVLEWFWHLGGDQEQQAAQSQQAGRRSPCTKAGERTASQAAQSQDLEQLDRAQRGDGEEPDCEQARVDGDQGLARGQRRRHDGE
jgi:hypothetical protein